MEPKIVRRDLIPIVIETEEIHLPEKKEEVLEESVVIKSNLNLNSVKGYKEKKKQIKYSKLKNEAILELRNALKIFNKDELDLNHSVVLFCCQIVEDLFTSSGKGQIKKEVVVEVCKEFFDGKESVVEMVVDLVFDKITKTTFFRRNKNKLKSIGFFLLEKVTPNLQSLSSSKLRAL
jgi:hypothetical protein